MASAASVMPATMSTGTAYLSIGSTPSSTGNLDWVLSAMVGLLLVEATTAASGVLDSLKSCEGWRGLIHWGDSNLPVTP